MLVQILKHIRIKILFPEYSKAILFYFLKIFKQISFVNSCMIWQAERGVGKNQYKKLHFLQHMGLAKLNLIKRFI